MNVDDSITLKVIGTGVPPDRVLGQHIGIGMRECILVFRDAEGELCLSSSSGDSDRVIAELARVQHWILGVEYTGDIPGELDEAD
jgi:hypothetical protein